MHRYCPVWAVGHSGLTRTHQQGGQRRIGLKQGLSIQGNLIARKKRRCIHVVLQKRAAHHYIADGHTRAHPACHAGKHDLTHTKGFDQRHRSGRSGHFANARQGQHHGFTCQSAAPKCAPCALHAARVFQLMQQALLLLRQCAQNGGGDGHRVNAPAIPGAVFCRPVFWAAQREIPPLWAACSRSGFLCNRRAPPPRSMQGLFW